MIDLQELKEKEFFLLTGDSLERLKEIPDNSIDSIVTDPPYGLGKEPDALQMLKDWIQTGHHDVKAKSGFMGKEWDAFVPQPVLWAECLRVLKPGGHILSFAGTRTYDLVVLGLRMAGFEIRDQLAWVYGSGFPKSMDVSKSILNISNPIDKDDIWKINLLTANSVVQSLKKNQIEVGHSITKNYSVQDSVVQNHKITNNLLNAIIVELACKEVCHTKMMETITAQENVEHCTQPVFLCVTHVESTSQNQIVQEPVSVHTVPDRATLFQCENTMGKIMVEEVQRIWIGRNKFLPSEDSDAICAGLMSDLKHIILNQSKIFLNLDTTLKMECASAMTVIITKYTMECLITNMVDIQKRNNSKQWQGWGTALKPAHEPIFMARKPVVGTIAQNVLMWHTGALNIDGCRIPLNGECDAAGANTPDAVGRFPANLIHDGSDEVISVFPDSTGAGKSLPQVKITGYGNKNTGNGTSDYFGGDRIPFDSGSGSAARFFYCAKASRNDRHDGIIDDPEPQFKHGDTLRKIENVDTVGNNHPTVKPTALMRYLVRLVTPPNGIVLDPFNGSGSTGKAAVLEGFKYIGCDLDENYINISRNRIQYAVDNREIINSPVKSDKKKIEKVVKSTAATLECFFE